MPSRLSLIFWNRLEPRPRGKSLRRSLAAQMRDPVWMLTRQWQLGEFQGEDAASPSSLRVETETIALDQWQAGDQGGPMDNGAPLEPQLFAEPYVPDLALRVEIAQTFVRLVGRELDLGPLRDTYPLPIPDAGDPLRPVEPAARRFASFMAPRWFDGFALCRDIVAGISIPGQENPTVRAAAAKLIHWVQTTYGGLHLGETERDPAAWNPQRLEHRAAVRATDSTGAAITLAVHPDNGGELDWDSFEVIGQSAGDPSAAIDSEVTEIQPTHVRFVGMPNARFWDLEDSAVSFADIEPDPRDLAKMMVVEFALVHGVDWLTFDLPQPVGTLRRMRQITVKDVFGGETLVERAAGDHGPRWALFQLSRATGAAQNVPELSDFLLIPPTSVAAQQAGEPLEEVLFARDEMANLVWAIERATASAIGTPWPGSERADAMPRPAARDRSGDEAALVYEIISQVPVHWTPFVPARVNAGGDSNRPRVLLVSAEVIRDPVIPEAIRGKILRPDGLAGDRAYVVHEEEVLRPGVRVRRQMIRARWQNGSSHLWFARVRTTGSGETGSGLRFDNAKDTQAD